MHQLRDTLHRNFVGRLASGFAAGTVATLANSGLLKMASLAGISTAHGGLLRLLELLLESMTRLVSPTLKSGRGSLLPVAAPWFQTAFHFVTGIVMSEFYALMLEPLIPGSSSRKGLLYGAVTWLFNAFIVLPLIGEGVAGSHHLQLSGILCFALAHMAFFVLLPFLFRYLVQPTAGRNPSSEEN